MSCCSTFLHLFFEFFDFDEMSWIEGKGWIVTVAFVRTEAAVGDSFPPGVHRRRVPKLREVPVVFAQIRYGSQDLAARNRAFIVNNCACRACPALELRSSFKGGLCDQFVHVDINSCLEESGIAGVA